MMAKEHERTITIKLAAEEVRYVIVALRRLSNTFHHHNQPYDGIGCTLTAAAIETQTKAHKEQIWKTAQ